MNPSLTHRAAHRPRALMTPLLLAMLLGGCTLMPDYQRPAAPVASQFAGDHSAAAASSTPAMAVSDIGWRDVFTDPPCTLR